MSTEIDWSKAPEGSEAARICRGDQVEFYRNANGRFEFYSFNFGAWIVSSTQKDDSRLIWRTGYAWSGEGLPPVGTVCEFNGGESAPEDPWHPDLQVGDQVEIIAHFDGGNGVVLAAFTFRTRNPNLGAVSVEQGNYGCFRPLRTPEQIAAEERDNAVHQMGLDAGFHGSVQDFATRLYMLGYRKVTQ